MSVPPLRTAEPPREVEVTVELARALLADQHPDLANLPIRHVEDGWDNVVLRLGDALALRMPRRAAAASLIVTEQTWLPTLAPRLTLPAPAAIRTGAPGRGWRASRPTSRRRAPTRARCWPVSSPPCTSRRRTTRPPTCIAAASRWPSAPTPSSCGSRRPRRCMGA